MATQTLNGPGGLRIDLDSREIFPDDPGQGTPAMVHLLNASATYWWACGEGTVTTGDGRDVDLTQGQINWLHDQEDAVSDFIDQHSPA